MFKKLVAWIARHELVIILVIISFCLRLPSFFEPYWYGDEGIYLTLGEALKRGLVWYRDIHDNKPPLLYFLATIAGNVFWFRLLLAAWFGTSVVVFFRLVQKIIPQKRSAWTMATIAMIGLTTIFEGNIANAEIFIVLPVVLALLLAIKPKTNWWLVGLLYSVGFLFKVPAVFDLLALGLWQIFWRPFKLSSLIKLSLGFALPILLTIGYYAYQGALEPYVRSALLQNIGYLNSWSSGEHTASGFTSQSGLIIRLALACLFSAGIIYWGKRTKHSPNLGLMFLWFIWALFGALLSERPYPHYLIQPAIPLAILVAVWLTQPQRLVRLIIIFLFSFAGIAYIQIRFWQYPIIPYYQNWLSFALGQKNEQDYWRWFDWRVPQTYSLSGYIRATTLPRDKIFVWGDEPYIYALSRRLPIGRFTVSYHILDFNGFGATLKAWDQNAPKLVAVMKYETRKFPELEARLAADYILTTTIDQAQVYRRLNSD